MIVIADTGPINYLVLIDEIEVLCRLYSRVATPSSVCQELKHSSAPEKVRAWISLPPTWLEVFSPTLSADAHLAGLDAGERDAILLAEEFNADQIIVDEMRGRREAQRRNIPYTGTLGVLAAGAERGLLDLRNAVDRLRQTTFRISTEILDRLMEGKW